MWVPTSESWSSGQSYMDTTQYKVKQEKKKKANYQVCAECGDMVDCLWVMILKRVLKNS